MAANRKGQAWAILAASEMGKGVWFKQWLKRERPTRLLIWDRNDEYEAHARRVDNLQALALAVPAGASARFALRYVPKASDGKLLRAEFEMFCRIAYACVGSCIVVEELADVTSASYAPPMWQQLNTRGRHHQGLHIVAHSQSPAWVDKRFLGNATFLHVGFLGTKAHRQAVADEIGCDPEEIRALAQFDYIQYTKATKELTRGRVKLPARRS